MTASLLDCPDSPAALFDPPDLPPVLDEDGRPRTCRAYLYADQPGVLGRECGLEAVAFIDHCWRCIEHYRDSLALQARDSALMPCGHQRRKRWHDTEDCSVCQP